MRSWSREAFRKSQNCHNSLLISRAVSPDSGLLTNPMSISSLLLLLGALAAFGYFTGRARARAQFRRKASGHGNLHSRPHYYGYMVAIWAGLPALLILLLWSAMGERLIPALTLAGLPEQAQQMTPDQRSLFLNEVRLAASEQGEGAPAVAEGAPDREMKRVAVARYRQLRRISVLARTVVVITLAIFGMLLALRWVRPDFKARNQVERTVVWVMIACASIAIMTTVGIVLSVLFESMRFFGKVPVTEFLFGTQWSPQMALRADQVAGSGSFGVAPLFAGTMLISAIALLIAVPLGLMSAIYLSEYAAPKARAVVKPALEILAGIPTVVYGFFAALTVAPFIRQAGEALGLHPASESALAAGVVMGIMIIPFVSSLSDDVISAVPQAMRDGALGMGATRSETIRQVVIPAALPGIVGGVLLAASRAIGETMIVVMAAGLSANLTINPLEAVTTVTVQIVTLLTGDQEFDSAKTLAAFALGLTLFLVTLALNVISLMVVRRYREQYE